MNKPLFETIQGFGYDLAIKPVDFIVKKGVIGRLLALILLFIWCFPILLLSSFVAFFFWIFEQK